MGNNLPVSHVLLPGFPPKKREIVYKDLMFLAQFFQGPQHIAGVLLKVGYMWCVSFLSAVFCESLELICLAL